MTKHERAKEIATYRKEMKKLVHEFMTAENIAAADVKLDELTILSAKVAELKQEQKKNGLITKLKKKIGL